MFDNILKQIKNRFFADTNGRPSIIGKALGAQPVQQKPAPTFAPKLPTSIPLQKPTIAPKITVPNKVATDIVQNKLPGVTRNSLGASQSKAVLGTNIRPTAMPKAPIVKQPITPTPTPNPKDSWANFREMVIREGNKRGYNGEIVARQKANESNWGTSSYAKKRNNYGGVGAYDANPDNAFEYASPEEYLMGKGTKGEMGYFKLIENDPRYREAYKHRGNPKKFIEELKKAGYASDPDYVWKVQNTRLDSPYE